jgi:hypothetical protein
MKKEIADKLLPINRTLFDPTRSFRYPVRNAMHPYTIILMENMSDVSPREAPNSVAKGLRKIPKVPREP